MSDKKPTLKEVEDMLMDIFNTRKKQHGNNFVGGTGRGGAVMFYMNVLEYAGGYTEEELAEVKREAYRTTRDGFYRLDEFGITYKGFDVDKPDGFYGTIVEDSYGIGYFVDRVICGRVVDYKPITEEEFNDLKSKSNGNEEV